MNGFKPLTGEVVIATTPKRMSRSGSSFSPYSLVSPSPSTPSTAPSPSVERSYTDTPEFFKKNKNHTISNYRMIGLQIKDFSLDD